MSSLLIGSLGLIGCDSDDQRDEMSAGDTIPMGGEGGGIQAGIEGGAHEGGGEGGMGAGEEGGESMAGSMAPWVSIGTGFRRFESLSEGQEVPIIAGIQGGFHVWGGFIGSGFSDTDVRIEFVLKLDGTPYAHADYLEFELPKNSQGQFEYAGVSVIYDRNEDVEPTSGNEMTLELKVSTQDGLILEDQVNLIPLCCE